jgi:hypothetical protein
VVSPVMWRANEIIRARWQYNKYRATTILYM